MDNEYYYKHKEKMTLQNTINKNKKKDYYLILRRNWRRSHPEKCKIYNEKHKNHKISPKERESMLKIFNHRCAYCGMTEQMHLEKFHERLHNDHVDPNGANDLSNDIPACKSCNCSKHTSDMEQWYRKQSYFSKERLSFIKWWITKGYLDYIENTDINKGEDNSNVLCSK